jgi:hypothetical protein
MLSVSHPRFLSWGVFGWLLLIPSIHATHI